MPQAKPYSFPAFYACYLLKSARTPRSYRNYIGSTPDPVRRLRQHNGLVTGGARETAVNRPWVMHLLVHGFPSRPAATSFEFAWQNPHRSRFLRNDTAEPLFERKRGAKFQHNVLVLQQMIRTYPFSTWPLHVKLFTEEAVQCWNKLTSTSPMFAAYQHHFQCHNSDGENRADGDECTKEKEHKKNFQLLFPPGFTCSVELEGIDGRSGLEGSGREGSICITDEHFTSSYLAKSTTLIASGHRLNCSVCKTPIDDFPANHLETLLCPHTTCTSVSHLGCLAKLWLETERNLVASSHVPLTSSTLLSSPSLSSSPISSPGCPTFPHSFGHLPASGSATMLSTSPHPPMFPCPSPSRSSETTPAFSTSLTNSTPTTNNSLLSLESKAEFSNTRLSNSGPHSCPSHNPHLPGNPFNLGKGMLPRGGTCLSCEQYTLWGDIVKGCFRRHTGRIIEDEDVDPDQKMLEAAEEEVEGIKEQAELEGISYSGLSVDARSSRSRSMTRSPSTYLRSRSRVEDKAETLTRKLELLSLEDTTSRASPRGKASTTSKGKIARPKAGTCDGSKVTAKGNYKANAKRSNVTKGSSSLLTPASAVLEVNGSTVLLSRGHGRPKKVTGDSEADLNSPNSGGVTTTPKRTGRPRKHVVDPVISTSRGERPSKQSAVSAVIPIEPPSSISTVMSREVSSPPICSTDLALEQENQSEALLETKLEQPATSTPQEHGISPERQNDDQSTTTVPNEEIIQRNSPYPKMARPKRRGRPRKSASVGDLSDG